MIRIICMILFYHIRTSTEQTFSPNPPKNLTRTELIWEWQIEFVVRRDAQVKIRVFRVELTEIEAIIWTTTLSPLVGVIKISAGYLAVWLKCEHSSTKAVKSGIIIIKKKFGGME